MHDIIDGCSYRLSYNNKPIEIKVLRHDPISGEYVILHGGKEKMMNLGRMTSKLQRVRPSLSKKTDTTHVFLYLCQLSDGKYKIGVSANPRRRLEEIQTIDPKAKMIHVVGIPSARGTMWRSFERKVHRKFSSHRVNARENQRDIKKGDEIFRFRPHMIQDVKSSMNVAVCADLSPQE